MPTSQEVRVHPTVERWAAYAWRVLLIGLLVVAVLWLLGQLLVVVIPIVVALLLTRALAPVDGWLRRVGLPRGLAAGLTVLAFLVVLTGTFVAVSVSVASELGELGTTVSEGIDQIETWLVEDSPFEIERSDLQRWRREAGQRLSDLATSSQGSLASGAVLAAEMAVGFVLAIIVTFFLLKDRQSLAGSAVARLAPERRERIVRMGRRAWKAMAGYLRGAATLGIIEAVIIGLTLLLVGSSLVVPVMVVTFVAAFVPIVGAVLAGVVAVLVAWVTAGSTAAIVVAVVAIVVQQLDNDVLAPVIYGRALRLHPLVILLGIAAGSALFGLVGTFLAVPVLAVGLSVADEARSPAHPDQE